MRVSDYLARHLAQIGVDRVFLLSGGGMMYLIDAIGRAGIPYTCCHHEQACAMAAEGYARQTGRLGVSYATSGPGATNLLTGIVGAWQDSSPVLFITGQSKRSQTIRLSQTRGLRQFGTFEVDIVPIVESVTKFAHFLDDPNDIRWVLEKAVHLATTGRPGPVLIDVPLDVQGALIDPDALASFTPPSPQSMPVEEQLQAIRERFIAAQRPTLLIGHGVRCAGAVPLLRDVIDHLQWPTVTTQLAKDALPHDHAMFVGHCGPKGDRAGNFAIQNADLIVSIGSSLHAQSVGYEADLFAPGAYKVQVDIERPVLDRGDLPVDFQVETDVVTFLAGLRTWPADAHAARWGAHCRAWKRDYAVAREPHDISTEATNFYEFAAILSDCLQGDETIVTDAGSAFYVLGQAFLLKDQQRYIVSGALGAMGYALPAAIGAASADPAATIICVTGDGSLQTNIHELQTLKHNGFNVKLFVVDNDGYASIRNTQSGFFNGQYVGASRDSGVSTPPLDAIISAYDLPFVRASTRHMLRAAITSALQTPGPVVVGITAQSHQTIIPTVASRQLPDGRLRSNPIHEMSPPLPPEEVERIAREALELRPAEG